MSMQDRLNEILSTDYLARYQGRKNAVAVHEAARTKARDLLHLEQESIDFNVLAEERGETTDYAFTRKVAVEFDKIICPGTNEPFMRTYLGSHRFIHGDSKLGGGLKNRILILKEKHAIVYYDISTPLKAARAVLSVVKQRMDHWYGDDKDQEEALKILQMAIDEGLIKGAKAAFCFLHARKDYQYEGFEVDYMTEATLFK